jgi:hypothetical protein
MKWVLIASLLFLPGCNYVQCRILEHAYGQADVEKHENSLDNTDASHIGRLHG